MLKKDLQWKSRFSSSLVVAVLLLLGLGLRAYQLGRTLGGGDENEVLTYYVLKPLTYITTTYIENFHHIFHTVLLHFMAVWFGGENEYAIRAPAFVSGIACLWMIYKTAHKLFDSLPVAQLSLLVTAISPIHIYYSQTARGYSLTIFLSIMMVYSAVMLLDAFKNFSWTLVFGLCGFLAVYTIPLNAILVFCLGIWIFYVSTHPQISQEFDFHSETALRRFAFFLSLFLCIGFLSFLAYLPIWSEFFIIAEQVYLKMPPYESRIDMALNLVPDVVARFFPGKLQWFSPFILLGILFLRPARISYRYLAIFVFGITYLIPLTINATWLPRSYLFCFPLLVIFLSAGIIGLGKILDKRSNLWKAGSILSGSLIVLYVLISYLILIKDYYPTTKIPDGKLLKKNIINNSDPLELILVASPKQYYYVRSIHSDNLKDIVLMNQVSGVKMVAADFAAIENYKIFNGGKEFLIFRDLFSPNKLESIEVQENLKIFSLAGAGARVLLPDDFEAEAQWRVVRGSGRVKIEKSHILAGKHSLFLQADPDDIFAVEGQIPGVFDLKDKTLVVLGYGGYNPTTNQYGPENVLISPSILVHDLETQRENNLRIGPINFGIRNKLRETSNQGETFDWNLFPYIGIIPPGKYTLSLHLRSPPGREVYYDGLRLFLVETPNAP